MAGLSAKNQYDAVIVGSGPNGLAAAITFAKAGHSVLVLEAQEHIGGGTRSDTLTLPGFIHDVCSAVHPMAAVSPFFHTLPLQDHGLEWVHPPFCLAHPLDDGSSAVIDHSLETTCETLSADSGPYRSLIGTIAANWKDFENDLLGPIGLPTHPVRMARFGMHALQPATLLARTHFRTDQGRALFAGLAAHSLMPLEAWGTAAIGLVIGAVAHVAGWPIAKGGSQRIADALTSYLRSLGGEIVTGERVRSLNELPPAKAVLCDVSPRGLLDIAGDTLPARYRHALERFEYGAGVFKVDWALRDPIPWKAEPCRKAGTVHIGGTLEEIARAERECCTTEHSERPFVLLSQPSLFDPTRAPAGHHTAWAYCHVPNRSTVDMTERIEAQIERFAPGFRDLVLARSTRNTAQLEKENANLVGGNVTGGANSLRQLFLRPTLRCYETPLRNVYLCSASTPPGGGVHGMCGVHAAARALARMG
jgi:phytoene dehydrogenase-like protein